MNVLYAPRAMRDLESIGAYLLERNPTGAANVLGAVKSSIDTLSFFPQIGRLIDNAGHRRVPVLRYPYLIFYRVVRSTRRPNYDAAVARHSFTRARTAIQ